MQRRSSIPAAVVLSLFLSTPVAAQDGVLETVGDDLEDAGADILYIWSSPLRIRAGDLPALAAVGGAVALVGAVDGQIQEAVRENARSPVVRALGPFRESRPLSKVGYTKILLTLSGGLYTAGLVFDSDDMRRAGIGCATADVANTLARHSIARLIGRLRPQARKGPYVIDLFAFGDWEMRSFPAGHAANVMSCVTFWNEAYDLGVAEPALYLLAGAVSAGRILDEAHWASDTLFGLAFGWAVGRGVASRFREREAEAASSADGEPAASLPRIYIGWRLPVSW